MSDGPIYRDLIEWFPMAELRRRAKEYMDWAEKVGYDTEPRTYCELLIQILRGRLLPSYQGVNEARLADLVKMGLVRTEGERYEVTELGLSYLRGWRFPGDDVINNEGMSVGMMDVNEARIRELEQEVADLKRDMAKLSEGHHLLVIGGELECSLKTLDEAKERAKELALTGRRGEVLVIEVHGSGAFYTLGPIDKL